MKVDEELMRFFDVDFRPVYYQTYKYDKNIIKGLSHYVDEWGIEWYHPPESNHYSILGNPLSDAQIEDLEIYNWPDPLNPISNIGSA